MEKMLQEHQRTLAPRATRVSISTAVCGRGRGSKEGENRERRSWKRRRQGRSRRRVNQYRARMVGDDEDISAQDERRGHSTVELQLSDQLG